MLSLQLYQNRYTMQPQFAYKSISAISVMIKPASHRLHGKGLTITLIPEYLWLRKSLFNYIQKQVQTEILRAVMCRHGETPAK